jgi:TetR/AcrR family transcriptional regulator, transcriptional repressor for nem operon
MDMREHILSIAQRLVQQRGYNGFSYADIATEVGIRKASLHHHFPTKADLGLALIDAYTEQFNAELQKIAGKTLSPEKKLKAYIALYRQSLEAERICLCGMLSSEVSTLDVAMLPKLTHFFALNTAWLAQLLEQGKTTQSFAFNGSATQQAQMILSTLQGALLIARAHGNCVAFDQTASLLALNLTRKG